jgi:PAS domain-containing protein
MRSLHGALYSAQVFSDAPPETGLFSWDLVENLLYADAAVAELFGLDPTDADSGLPIEAYLERVHPEDRPRLAEAIRDSIVAHRPQQQTYRVRNQAGAYQFVTGHGRGFRDKQGDTVRYVGVVIPSCAEDGSRRTAH